MQLCEVLLTALVLCALIYTALCVLCWAVKLNVFVPICCIIVVILVALSYPASFRILDLKPELVGGVFCIERFTRSLQGIRRSSQLIAMIYLDLALTVCLGIIRVNVTQSPDDRWSL